MSLLLFCCHSSCKLLCLWLIWAVPPCSSVRLETLSIKLMLYSFILFYVQQNKCFIFHFKWILVNYLHFDSHYFTCLKTNTFVLRFVSGWNNIPGSDKMVQCLKNGLMSLMDCLGWYLSGKMEQLGGHTVGAGEKQTVKPDCSLWVCVEFHSSDACEQCGSLSVQILSGRTFSMASMLPRQVSGCYRNIHTKGMSKRRTIGSCLDVRVKTHTLSSVCFQFPYWHN